MMLSLGHCQGVWITQVQGQYTGHTHTWIKSLLANEHTATGTVGRVVWLRSLVNACCSFSKKHAWILGRDWMRTQITSTSESYAWPGQEPCGEGLLFKDLGKEKDIVSINAKPEKVRRSWDGLPGNLGEGRSIISGSATAMY